MDKPLWMWAAFLGIVLFLLVLDLGVFHRKQKEIGVRDSLVSSAMYICIGLLFGLFVWHQLGADSGKEYFTGFLIEKTLSMDNIFVISLIFTHLAIPRKYQHRVLFWGILGVIVLRAIMIGVGATLVKEVEWVLYIFAAFLIFTGIKMLFASEKHEMGESKLLKWISRHFRVTKEIEGQKFFVSKYDENTGKYARYMTPLMVALIMVELTDLVFAVDSVPAIFAITTDPYIVYTSNIFAILGLRALYFALDAVIHRFHYLKYALSLVLVFIGSKVFIADLMGFNKFPPSISLGVTVGLLAAGVLYSLYKTRKSA
ncbi:MAG: TerC family protein [Alphaproteobacteria bacterium]|nr:TerC family protein [Alphaproteobacteria bacterium]